MTTPDDTPERLDGTMLGRLLAGIPEDVRARVQPDTSRARDVESPAEAAERRALVHAHRGAQWDARCPLMFAQARLADMRALPEPERERARVTGWLDSGHRTLVLWSDVQGNGKTHMAYAVGHAAVDRGLWTLAYTVADLNAALRPEGSPGAWEAVTGCDVLILDDLGREHDSGSGWGHENLQRLFDLRGREGKRVVVTTNLTGEQMLDRYGDPLVGRISDDAVIVKFTGPTRRRPAPW